MNARQEPEGESRDTEDESDRDGSEIRKRAISRILNGPNVLSSIKDQIYGYANVGRAHEDEYVYCIPKLKFSSDIKKLEVKSEKASEDIYASVNKIGSKKTNLPVPEEVWDVTDIKNSLTKVRNSNIFSQNENLFFIESFDELFLISNRLDFFQVFRISL